jgi:hypothetical protein
VPQRARTITLTSGLESWHSVKGNAGPETPVVGVAVLQAVASSATTRKTKHTLVLFISVPRKMG